MSDPNEFHFRLSQHLRKRIKDTADQLYFFGLAETDSMSSFLRAAAIEKIERDIPRIEAAERRLTGVKESKGVIK